VIGRAVEEGSNVDPLQPPSTLRGHELRTLLAVIGDDDHLAGRGSPDEIFRVVSELADVDSAVHVEELAIDVSGSTAEL
jgi:hypothetical protein